ASARAGSRRLRRLANTGASARAHGRSRRGGHGAPTSDRVGARPSCERCRGRWSSGGTVFATGGRGRQKGGHGWLPHGRPAITAQCVGASQRREYASIGGQAGRGAAVAGGGCSPIARFGLVVEHAWIEQEGGRRSAWRRAGLPQGHRGPALLPF